MSKKHAIIKEDGFIYYSKSKGMISIKRTVSRYPELLSALLSDDFDEASFLKLITKLATSDIETASDGKMSVVNGKLEATVSADGSDDQILVLPTDIQARVIQLMREGVSYEYLEKFWRRCLSNPNRGSTEQLYAFLIHNRLTITDDGCFLAYKAVKNDFTDFRTGTFDNSPGRVVSMPREQVTFDPNIACSFGLHVSTLGYARAFGGANCVIVVAKVDPADVVSVPFDYDNQKIRTCRYEVLRVWEGIQECSHTVVDSNLEPVVETRNIDPYREWSRTEIEAIRRAVASTYLTLADKVAVCTELAARLDRAYDMVESKYDELAEELRQQPTEAPWDKVRSRVVPVDVRKELYQLVLTHGKQWGKIRLCLSEVFPRMAKVSTDTLRKVANRMGL